VTLALKPNTEPIPGYHVTDRLGVGGYGEVWKAEAPGGLQKAIKFIYGYMDDEKATRELKALNRVKEIRHPFLLSLERIENVDGQLLIVTELADGSLKDRFAACLENGLPAIPRGELLAYMRDAADALDFLSENALQHLDVKPENLLTVGGRMKVADFGLVKDIQDRSLSMMGGMTPVYAAPELFDGRPTAASDQYSLAIVYQEMLTGQLPFPGTTAAQLASQHLRSRPRLESLPESDVEIIARALSKHPRDRFPSSRAMVDALVAADSRGASQREGTVASPAIDADHDTCSAAAQETTPGTAKGSAPVAPRRPVSRTPPPSSATPSIRQSDCRTKTAPVVAKAPVIDLPPIDIQPEDVGLRPTLFLGIGGTAGYVLRGLRRRLSDRFGDVKDVPILQMLLVDTDSGALSRHWQTDMRGELDSAETLVLPLRKAQEYRADSLEILQWLSRRWLYNIPRSLKTEGLRPLGRLALVDHANELFDRLRGALSAIVAPESIERAQTASGLKLRDTHPRVFVISSISGGTGSGMVLDVAYAVRMLLADMGLSDEGLCGVLTHSTQRNASAKDLAVANAYACLSELYHYAREHYPGEPSCGLPAFEEHGTFPRAYFVHLGDRLSEEQFVRGTDALAEYLYLDAATAGGAFFDKCRNGDSLLHPDHEIQLRTLGVSQLGCSHSDLPTAASEWLCKRLVERWAAGSRPQSNGKSAALSASEFAARTISELKLDASSLVDVVQRELEQSFPRVMRTELCRKLVSEQTTDANAPTEQRWAALVERARRSLGLLATDDEAPLFCLTSVAETVVTRHVQQVNTELAKRVLGVANDAACGIGGALSAGEQLAEQVRRVEGELTAVRRALQERVSAQTAGQSTASSRRSKRSPDGPADSFVESLQALVSLVVQLKTAECALRLASSILHYTTTTTEVLVRARREAQDIARSFNDTAWQQGTSNVAAGPQNEIDRAVVRELGERMPKIAVAFEQRVIEEIVAPRGGLVQLLSASGEVLRVLPALVLSVARRAVFEGLKEIDIPKMVLQSDSDIKHENVERYVQTAWPSVLDCGGAKRLLLVMPDCPSAARLPEIIEQKRSEKPTVLYDSDCDVVACYEGEGVDLSNVAAAIAHNDPQCAEVAHRLHTRVDVEWSKM
jgi:serine/threonine protein kinase